MFPEIEGTRPLGFDPGILQKKWKTNWCKHNDPEIIFKLQKELTITDSNID